MIKLETEIKFSPVSEDTAAEIFDALNAEHTRIILMDARYFDTELRELKKAGFSLRLRRENDDSVCCVKGKAQGLSRPEYEVLCSSLQDGIARLRDRLPPEILPILSLPLVEQYQTKFTRRCALVSCGKSKIELAFDSGFMKKGGLYREISEIELELKDGENADLLALARILAEKFALSVCRETKAHRANALTPEFFAGLTPISSPEDASPGCLCYTEDEKFFEVK